MLCNECQNRYTISTKYVPKSRELGPKNLFNVYFVVKVTFALVEHLLVVFSHCFCIRKILESTKPLCDLWIYSLIQYSIMLKTYAAISNAHLSRVCKRGKMSGSCLSTLNGFGSTQLPIFLCHIGVPTFSSQNN